MLSISDLQYFGLALSAYVKKNKYDAKMPMCAEVLSTIIADAQTLKDKARKDAQPDDATT